jgi:hypothetical protein
MGFLGPLNPNGRKKTIDTCQFIGGVVSQQEKRKIVDLPDRQSF